MIEIKIKPEWIKNAEEKAKDLGVLKHSFMKGDGNVAGFVGEFLVADFLKGKIENTYDYDIVKNNIKIDVKTKRCTSEPKSHYECSISAYNISQKCDFYVFVRILQNMEFGWIVGFIKKKDFYKKAKFYKKGYIDVSNFLEFKVDTYNLEISNLLDFESFLTKKNKIVE